MTTDIREVPGEFPAMLYELLLDIDSCDGFHYPWTDFMWRIYFDLYARWPDVLEVKNGKCHWKNLENKRKKKKHRVKKINKHLFSYFTV